MMLSGSFSRVLLGTLPVLGWWFPLFGQAPQLRLATREDVNDARYVEAGVPFVAVGSVQIGRRACTGTLVTSLDGTFKVLTAAHCVDRDFDNQPDVAPSEIRFVSGAGLEGASASGESIALPLWDERASRDLAVITLGAFRNGPAPFPMTVSSNSPVGQLGTLVGFGTHGTGTPPFENSFDSQRRAASNIADFVAVEGERAGQIRTDFDHPNDPSFSTLGSEIPTELEGTSGVGDSGAPLIVDNHVVGILHGGENPTPFGFSEYGDVSIFAGLFYPPNQTFLRENGVLVAGSGDADDRITIQSNASPPHRLFLAPDGTPLDSDSVIRIGSLPEGFDLAAASLGDVARAWQPFEESPFGDTEAERGRFSISQSAEGTALAGTKIYWWVLETLTAPPDLTLANVTSWAVFSSSASHWRFPEAGTSEPVVLTSSEVTQSSGPDSIGDSSLTLSPAVGFTLDYSSWALSVFPQSTPEGMRSLEADPDGDHLPNGIEWIMGSSPQSPTSAPAFHIERSSGGTILIRYVRQRTIPPGAESVQFSPNIQQWVPAQPLRTTTRVIDLQFESVELEFATGSTEGRSVTKSYWRLTTDGD